MCSNFLQHNFLDSALFVVFLPVSFIATVSCCFAMVWIHMLWLFYSSWPCILPSISLLFCYYVHAYSARQSDL